VIIDDDAVRCALPNDNNIHAADYGSVVVKKINIGPSQMLGNEDRALVGPQDQVDNFRIGDGNLSKWTLAMNCCREPLGKHNRLLRWLLDRERHGLIAEAFGCHEKKKRKRQRRRD
jgi:hypothetical protein